MQLTKKQVLNPRKLDVYQCALKFKSQISSMIKGFPELEKYNMVDQLRRASTSIVANISEGIGNHYYGKERDRLNSALGSAAECQSFLDMARMEDYISQEQYRKLDDEAEIIFQMLLTKIREIDKILDQKGIEGERK